MRENIETERVRYSICHDFFDRDINREEGRLISCPAHSFGEVREEDYLEQETVIPNTQYMKKYQIIYADPPWEVKAGAGNLHIPHQKTRDLSYPTMSLAEIEFMGDFVKDLADKDSVLFLWTINKYIEQSYRVARAWGFEPSTMLVWAKKPKGRGLGGTFGTSTEYLLFCRRGSLKAKERHWSTWFEAKRGLHSEKPKIAREIIEKCFDGNKIELFARKKTEGWDVWGNEIKNDIELK